MKQQLLALIIIMFSASCANESPISGSTDSLDVHIDIDSLKRDSIMKSEPNKLFADFNIGMTKKQFENAKRAFEKKVTRKDEYNYDALFLGDYRFLQILPQFNNGRLYMVYFNAAPIDYMKYNTELDETYNSLNDIISKKYFAPSTSSKPSMSSFKKGYSYQLSEWDLKNRIVEIRLEEAGLNYSLALIAYDKSIVDSLNNLENKTKSDYKQKSINAL